MSAWRKCSEGMPERHMRVIVMNNGVREISYWTDFGEGPRWMGKSADGLVTHWQPLPEPPEEETK